jgi:hypothetical protein
LHHPDAFDPEMALQLRERNTTTLEEMQKIAVDVEANLMNKKAKLKAEEKDRIEKERMISSEMKLDILTNTVNGMMQRIIRKEELVVQRPHIPLVPTTKVNIPKTSVAQPLYQGLNNDSFMYSIHNTVEDEVQNQKMEENSPDMICMFNGISSMDDLPNLDRYDDDYTTMDFSKKSTTSDWEEEDHLQSQQDNQSIHGNYDNYDHIATNFQESEDFLPLCFASLLRKHYKQIANSKNEECSNELGQENRGDIEVVADSEVHPLSLCATQNSDENTKPRTGNELIHFDSLPLCFNSFPTLKGNLGHILVEYYSVSHEMPSGQIPQSSKIFYDPIANMLDRLCFQSQISFTPNVFKNCYDMYMIRQSSIGVYSTKVSFQNPSKNL